MNATSQTIADRLAKGSARGLGCTAVVVAEAQRSDATLRELVAALGDPRSVVTGRAANALRKVQQAGPERVSPHMRMVLQAALECEDLRTRWNLTLVIGARPLTGRAKALAVELFFEALASQSPFLRVFALSGLANYAMRDAALGARVQPIVEQALEDRSAAMRARARKLLKQLEPAHRPR